MHPLGFPNQHGTQRSQQTHQPHGDSAMKGYNFQTGASHACNKKHLQLWKLHLFHTPINNISKEPMGVALSFKLGNHSWNNFMDQILQSMLISSASFDVKNFLILFFNGQSCQCTFPIPKRKNTLDFQVSATPKRAMKKVRLKVERVKDMQCGYIKAIKTQTSLLSVQSKMLLDFKIW